MLFIVKKYTIAQNDLLWTDDLFTNVHLMFLL